MANIILAVISFALIAACSLWYYKIPAPAAGIGALQNKRNKRYRIIASLAVAAGGFLLLTSLLNIFNAPDPDAHHEMLEVSISPERVDIFGIDVGLTVVYSWIAMAILITAAIVIRFTIFRNPSDTPGSAQNAVETVVEIVCRYTKSRAHGTGELLSSYILSIGSFLVMCAFLELFRLRAPTSDIAITFALAFMTFIIINVYGIKRKGVMGRLKSLASPTPIVFPFRLISEIAIPVSLACRLFGNMLGGLIVVDLLYTALGNAGGGIPGVLGLFFNAFHPLIQVFIFVTLTLTFINEAIE